MVEINSSKKVIVRYSTLQKSKTSPNWRAYPSDPWRCFQNLNGRRQRSRPENYYLIVLTKLLKNPEVTLKHWEETGRTSSSSVANLAVFQRI